MMPTKKRIRRHIHIPGKETASERQARTAVRYIKDNPHFAIILRAIRQGAPNTKIAEFCINRGIFDVNQKTAVGYLQYFRKIEWALCRPVAAEENESNLDNLFDGGTIILDEEVELLRLIAVQKARLGIGYSNERQLNMLIDTNRKEVTELRELLMELARLRGKVGNSLDVNLHGYSDNVRDDLKGIQQDQGARGTLAALVADLARQ